MSALAEALDAEAADPLRPTAFLDRSRFNARVEWL